MIFRTPDFWYARKTATAKGLLCAGALSPIGALYGFLARMRFDLYHPIPLSKPVLCVGNLVAGGAGKTPVVMSIVKLLQHAGFNPHILSKGYGGSESGPLQVSPGRDTAEDVGDEPLLLVDAAPTWVSKNRPLGAQAAIDTGANVVVMDDGFQNPAMFKDLAMVVIDGAVGFGNGMVFPAGPLREQVPFGLARADAVILLGDDTTGVAAKIAALRPELPIHRAALVPSVQNPHVAGQAVYAFAGIGRPEKFRATLEAAGARVEGWGAFPDHYAYTADDLKDLIEAARAAKAMILTTAKDYVRLPPACRDAISVFAVDVAWADESALTAQLTAALNKAGVFPA